MYRRHFGLSASIPILLAVLAAPAWCQDPLTTDSPIAPAAPAAPHKDPFNEDRIMKVMPDYQTVRDPNSPDVQPLTARQKWQLGWKETVDPFNIASAAMAAGFSQAAQQTPEYGVGAIPYTERFGAAVADFGTQNFISAGCWRSGGIRIRLLPQAKRHHPPAGALLITRIFVCENDSRQAVFNSSGIFGMMLGIAASNLYFARQSEGGSHGRPAGNQPLRRCPGEFDFRILARSGKEVLPQEAEAANAAASSSVALRAAPIAAVHGRGARPRGIPARDLRQCR